VDGGVPCGKAPAAVGAQADAADLAADPGGLPAFVGAGAESGAERGESDEVDGFVGLALSEVVGASDEDWSEVDAAGAESDFGEPPCSPFLARLSLR